jgi:hypothetical protein
MREGFLTGLHRNWFAWSGWLFTIGGTVFGLWAGGALAWVGALCAAAGLCALTALAYQRHRELESAERRHAAEIDRLERNVQTARERAEQAERKLNEVPADILLQIEATIRGYAFADLAAVLSRHADYVARMVELAKETSRPIAPRTFAKRAGQLYVEAKMPSAAISCLRDDDPFLLEFKGASGLVTASAVLRVHQLDAPKELVWFRVASYSGDEMAHVEALAEKQEVPGKGYTARPVADPARYLNRNLGDLATVIRTLVEELTRFRE